MIEKVATAAEFLAAIRQVRAGPRSAAALVHRPRSSTSAHDDIAAAAIATLTRREHEIVALVAAGKGTMQIVRELRIAERTVRNHLASIYDKLVLTSRLELALYALRHGLASTNDAA